MMNQRLPLCFLFPSTIYTSVVPYCTTERKFLPVYVLYEILNWYSSSTNLGRGDLKKSRHFG